MEQMTKKWSDKSNMRIAPDRGAKLVEVVDDAFSELDDARVSRLYPLLVEQGQLFIATPQANPVGINLKTRFSVSASGTVTL